VKVALLGAFVLAACAGAGDVDTNEVEVSPELDTKADATSELSVRAGDTTLWVNKTIALRGDTLVLRGRTSRNITDGRGYIFDDIYGQFAQVSPRVFELSWSLGEVRGLVDGIDQFIGLDFASPRHTTARVVVRPRLADFNGSSKVYLTAELTPVVVAGTVVYRISGHTYGANTGIRLVVDNADAGTVTRIDGEKFTIDLAPRTALDLIARRTDMQVIADFATGGVDKHVHLGLALKKLGMTAGDVEAAWPPGVCEQATKSCLDALPDTTLDLGRCGEAVKVNHCGGGGGVLGEEVAFQARCHAGGATAGTAAGRRDADALVGPDRADQFLYGAEQTVNSELEGMFGRWFLGASTLDTQLDLAVTRGFDRAYARPLDVVEPHTAVPGDAAAMRQVVADAVLAELARKDFVHSEFARSLEELVHEFRAQHLASIAAFRTSVVAEPYLTTKDVYIGDWLGLHTEVVIDRATGTVESTLVEID